MKPELEILSRNINVYMMYCGLNQVALAKKLGVASQAVSKWSRGVTAPTLDNIKAMCKIFGCTAGQLLEQEQTPKTIADAEREKRLMHYYKLLNDDGKDKLLEYLTDLNARYFKGEE